MAKQSKADETVHVSVRLPVVLVKAIDALANDERRIRTQMIRILLEDAIKDREK
jgi:metal-responsive CopG/Arc/MetJ family transcriptional regulator